MLCHSKREGSNLGVARSSQIEKSKHKDIFIFLLTVIFDLTKNSFIIAIVIGTDHIELIESVVIIHAFQRLCPFSPSCHI